MIPSIIQYILTIKQYNVYEMYKTLNPEASANCFFFLMSVIAKK